MPIEEALFALLTGDPDVSALLATRVFGVRTPEVGEPDAALPAVAYFRVSSRRFYTQDTRRGLPILASPRFQFDCLANDYDTARETARTIAAAMRGFSGTVAEVKIEGIFELDDRDLYNPQTKIFAVQKDFQVIHLE